MSETGPPVDAKPEAQLPRRGRARTGVITTTAATIVQILSQIVAMAVLSRLLSPADFGSTAAPIALATGLSLFVEYGFGANVIQRQTNERPFVGTAFTMVLLLGVLSTTAMVLLAPQISGWLGATEVWMVRLCAPILLLLPVATFLESLRLRDLEYKSVFWSNFSSTIIGQLALPIALALAGAGPMALIAAQLALHLVRIAVLLARGGLPGLAFRFSMLREMLTFSSFFTLTRFFNFTALQGDRVVLSSFASDTAVGLYVRAQNFSQILITLITTSLEKVLFPLLASISNDKSRSASLYLDTVRLLGICTGLISLGAIIYADVMVRILLGAQWMGVVPLARIFAVMIFLRSLDKAAAMLMRNEKMVKERCALQLLYATITIGAAATFGRYDFMLVAGTIVAGSALGLVYTTAMTSRYLGISFRQAAAPVVTGLGCVLVAAVTYLALLSVMELWHVNYEIGRALALTAGYATVTVVVLMQRQRFLGPRISSLVFAGRR